LVDSTIAQEQNNGLVAYDVEAMSGPITLFKSVGVGLQDVAIACAVVARAEEMEIGTRIAGYDG
jgi:ornithine cyclodeaminase/alanine dehydrogenase-like protein (mu-crystallin family)